MSIDRQYRVVWMAALWLCACLALPRAGADVVRVACIGDSITAGVGLASPDQESYPAQLGFLLGKRWEVRPFAVSGAPVVGFPEETLKQAMDYQPAMIVILLGSNDAFQGLPSGRMPFELSYEGMIGRLMSIASKPQVWICLPPRCFRETAKAMLEAEVIPGIRAVAARKALPVIDLYEATREAAEMFPDAVHPDVKGARLIAEEVSEGMTGERHRMKGRAGEYFKKALKERSLY